jgi:hypothetical protein
MQNTGKTFEKAIEEVFNFMYTNYPGATIENDVKINGPDGKRQFDVVINLKVPDGDLLTVIEGKDYRGKVSIQKVDEFHSKMKDVNANKGILISKMGFSSTAISKAKRLGITLYALNDHSTFSEFDLKINILVEEISFQNIDLIYSVRTENIIHIPEKIYFNRKIVINEENISEIINESWKDGSLKLDLIKEEQEVQIPKISPPFRLQYFPFEKSNVTKEVEIENLRLKIKIKYAYYICDVRDIMYNKMLKNINKETLTFFVDTNSLPEKLKNLTPVTSTFATQFTGIQYYIKIKNSVNIRFNSMEYVPQ